MQRPEVLVVGCLPQLLLFATLYFETESLWNLKFGDLADQQALGIVVFSKKMALIGS